MKCLQIKSRKKVCAFSGICEAPFNYIYLFAKSFLTFFYFAIAPIPSYLPIYPHLPLFFQLQASGGSSSSPSSPAAATPPAISDAAQPSAAKPLLSDAHPESEPKAQLPVSNPSQPQPSPAPEDPTKDPAITPGATTAATTAPVSDRHSPAVPQPARTPGSDDARSETTERPEGMPE